jgi:hypothetical protein
MHTEVNTTLSSLSSRSRADTLLAFDTADTIAFDTPLPFHTAHTCASTLLPSPVPPRLHVHNQLEGSGCWGSTRLHSLRCNLSNPYRPDLSWRENKLPLSLCSLSLSRNTGVWKRRYETQQVTGKGACRAALDYAANARSRQRAVMARVLDSAVLPTRATALMLLPTQRLDRRNESDQAFHRAQL